MRRRRWVPRIHALLLWPVLLGSILRILLRGVLLRLVCLRRLLRRVHRRFLRVGRRVEQTFDMK